MSDRELMGILNECIDGLAAGQSVEESVQRYLRHAAQLRLMLEIGLLVRRPQFSAMEISQAQDRVRFHVQQHLKPSGS